MDRLSSKHESDTQHDSYVSKPSRICRRCVVCKSASLTSAKVLNR